MQSPGLNVKSMGGSMSLGVLLTTAMLLTGCPAAMLLSAAVSDPKQGNTHEPNAKDYESWLGEPVVQLETHPQFGMLPREIRPVSDGSAMWLLRYCPARSSGPPNPDECCLYRFVVRDTKVTSYRTAGQCGVNCSMRPEAKVQACLNASMVPDGYH